MKDTWKERWNEIDYIEWQKRSQHPSPVVVEDFIESLLSEREAEVRKEIAEEVEKCKLLEVGVNVEGYLSKLRYNQALDKAVSIINPKP